MNVQDVDPDAFGAWCGIAAPLLLGTYLAVAGRLRRGYDRTRDTMSALGDGVDVAAFGFLVVNALVGLLLLGFAWRVLRPEFGWPWWIVAAGAGTSVVIGLTAGDESCALPGFYGRPWRHVHTVHLVVVGAALLGIGVLPALVWVTGAGPDEQQFRVVNAVLAVLVVPVALGVTAMIVAGRRQLRARLIHAGGRHRLARPWEEPTIWLDRWGLAEYLLWTVGYCWIVAAAVATWRPGWVVAATVVFAALATAATWWPQRIVPAVRFTVESCQQNTVHGVGGDAVVGEFRFLRIVDPAEFRRSLLALLDDGVIAGEQRRSRVRAATPDVTVTIGVTRRGLDALAVPYRWGGPRPDVFEQGMWARREALGDGPDDWDPHWQDVDVAVWAYARDRSRWGEARAAVHRLAGTRPIESLAVRRTLDDAPRPFNVKDGVSQPWMLGVPAPSRDFDPRGGGKLGPWGRWQPLALGEFVLGQVDEANDVLPVPDPAPLFIGATFAAVRKLEIDTGRREGLLAVLARGGDHQAALDRLVGRRADGCPLVAAPDLNRFRYGSDPEGLTCPITAHVRRANPRDALGFDGILANRRRMIRRGLTYVAGEDPGGQPRGVLFVALQSRLDDQFEFVQRSWLNDGAAFGLGRDPDALAGHWADGSRQVSLPGVGTPPTSALTPPIAVARGGAYLLVPSIRGLYYLAQGAGAVAPA